MTRLEQLISDFKYITESLHALHEIYESGSCNDCGVKESCQCKPGWGGQVRYNCPFHQREEEKTDDKTDDIRPTIDGGTVVDFTLYLCRKVQEHEPELGDLVVFICDMAKQFIKESAT